MLKGEGGKSALSVEGADWLSHDPRQIANDWEGEEEGLKEPEGS